VVLPSVRHLRQKAGSDSRASCKRIPKPIVYVELITKIHTRVNVLRILLIWAGRSKTSALMQSKPIIQSLSSLRICVYPEFELQKAWDRECFGQLGTWYHRCHWRHEERHWWSRYPTCCSVGSATKLGHFVAANCLNCKGFSGKFI
jgi:hypothetical protein